MNMRWKRAATKHARAWAQDAVTSRLRSDDGFGLGRAAGRVSAKDRCCARVRAGDNRPCEARHDCGAAAEPCTETTTADTPAGSSRQLGDFTRATLVF